MLRVLRLAERIARAEGADRTVVATAALLHDIARVEGDRSGRDHAALAAARVPALLAGQPEPLVAAIAHAVAAHRFRGTVMPATLEARVLFDADKLDAIGAIGIARAFAYGGLHGQRLWADLPLPGADPEPPGSGVFGAATPGAATPGAAGSGAAGSGAAGSGAEAPGEHTPVHEFVVKLARLGERLYTPTGRALAAERQAVMLAFYVRLRAEVRGEA